MRRAVTVASFLVSSVLPGVAFADMPADDCSFQDDCSYCSPDGVKDGYCEEGRCVEGDVNDCGSGCSVGGGPSRLGPTALVLAGVLTASAIAWSKKRRRHAR